MNNTTDFRSGGFKCYERHVATPTWPTCCLGGWAGKTLDWA